MMHADEKRVWMHIGLINLIAILFALAALAMAGCQPCLEVVADVTVTIDGGPVDAGPAAQTYCAQDCEKTADCPAGFHCSPVVNASDVGGLCFRNLNPDGGR